MGNFEKGVDNKKAWSKEKKDKYKRKQKQEANLASQLSKLRKGGN
jgi:hypothetical protein